MADETIDKKAPAVAPPECPLLRSNDNELAIEAGYCKNNVNGRCQASEATKKLLREYCVVIR